MKKLITLALVLILTLSMAVSVFAVDATVNDENLENQNNKANVNGLYVAEGGENVVSVNLTWTDVTWTYTVSQGEWNPATHEYDNATTAWNAPDLVITAENHSNCKVDVEFALSTGFDTYAEIDVTEDTLEAYNTEADSVVATVSKKDSAPALTDAYAQETVLGSVTVTIAEYVVEG